MPWKSISLQSRNEREDLRRSEGGAEQPPARVAPEPSAEFSLENVRVTINGKTVAEQRNAWMRERQ